MVIRKLPVIAAVVLLTAAAALAQNQAAPGAEQERERGKAEGYSPLGYYALLAYEQAYPAEAGSRLVLQAQASRYWIYRGIAYRNTTSIGSVWSSLGPSTTIQNPNDGGSENVSGRVSAMAVSPTCQRDGPCRLWLGTAGGGVWRTEDAMNTDDPGWRWIGTGLGTNSIGSLGLDPNDKTGNTIFVGTGETNQPNNSGAGTGLYRSTDGGDRWTRVSTMITDTTVAPTAIDFTFTRGIASVVVKPGDSNTIYVATTSAMLGMTAVRGGQTQTPGFPQPRTGLYKTVNGGVTWSLIWVPPASPIIPANPNLGTGVGDTMFGVRLVKLDPRDPEIVYATAFNNAIHRSAPSLEGGDGSFKPVFAIVGLQQFQDLAMFDLTVKDGRTRMYVYNGTISQTDQGLYRLDNAEVPASSLVTSIGGTLRNSTAWQGLTTSNRNDQGSTSRQICSSQCFYDLVVAVPDGEPDTVIIGGVAQPDFGEPTMRSTNAGVSFFGFGNDAQNPRNTSHVDVRVVVFHPKDRDIAWVGSDGGVVRNDGQFVGTSATCGAGNGPQCTTALSRVPRRLYFMNKGLQTMQFYNVSADPRRPLERLLGGLQDNGTIWRDGTRADNDWKALFPNGDGTSASGFHPSRSNVVFASFQSNSFFTNFANGDLSRWVRTGVPIINGNERATIVSATGRQFMSFDQVNPDTQFTGFQHVWRTQNNGGAQAFLEANCLQGRTTPAGVICGDWVPLGVAYPFTTLDPNAASRKPGDLTSDFYGTDRAGGIIVAAERSAGDAGTLWAATSFGRLFVSKNADVAGVNVQFVRIDRGDTPNRFITRILPDRANPNVAWVSYTGFNAITPTTPGHVFRVVYDPNSRQATFTSFDFDLGDLPINTIAYDDVRGDLYAGTDFGPLLLRNGSSLWERAGLAFPEALMVDLDIFPSQRLLIAATHGMGIYYLRLPN